MIYKVIYGTKEKIFKTLDKARAFRNKKKKKHNNIIISIKEEDVDPSNKIAGVNFSEALDKLTNLKL